MNIRASTIVVGLVLFVTSCAYTTVQPVGYQDRETKGYRVYDPQPILVSTCEATSIAFVPNFNQGYAVRPRSWLAKNKSTVKASSGILSEGDTDLDSTAFLTLFQTLGAEALKGVEKLAALGEGATGGLQQGGVWRMDYSTDGVLVGLTAIMGPYDCPNAKKENTTPSVGGGQGLPRP